VTKSKTIGLLGMGDMGSSVAKYLLKSNFTVQTNLDGRSKKSTENAVKSNVQVVSFESMIKNSDLIISIIPPISSTKTSRKISTYSRKLSKSVNYLDANAISPKTTLQIETNFYKNSFKNSNYIDGSIIGTSPNDKYKPRLYISGENSKNFLYLNSLAFEVINLGKKTELSSSLKMCYASLTKGSSALLISLILLAEKLNVLDHLFDELKHSQNDTLNTIKKSFPVISSKSERWIAEMEEIGSTYYENELNPGVFDNASYIYKLISKNKTKLTKLLEIID
tara:strand:+ start:4316 stop:5155 length:840 start_codon:yes stop_codon:yes gene_type:complete